MKLHISYATLLALLAPTTLCAPTASPQGSFRVATCGLETYLQSPTYQSCPLWDLGCLCTLPQESVTAYVNAIRPALDSRDPAVNRCTEGGTIQYKTLLKQVCEDPRFGKVVEF